MDFSIEVKNGIVCMPSRDYKHLLATKGKYICIYMYNEYMLGSIFFVMNKNKIQAEISEGK